MYPTRSLRSLAFRVHLKPAPRTQSESITILRSLGDLGPISTFQIIREGAQNQGDNAVANLTFSQNTSDLNAVRDLKIGRWSKVTANADHVGPAVADPFNVRGLKSRKPEPRPREFEYRIVPVDNSAGQDEGVKRTLISEETDDGQFKDVFEVDRNSVFAEILARSDCPSGLIHSLLPKKDNTHRSAVKRLQSLEVEKQKERFRRTNRKLMVQGYLGQKAGRDTDLKRLDLKRLQALGEDDVVTSATQGSEDSVNEKGLLKVYPEFEGLEALGLMKMYREAIEEDKSSVNT